MLNSVLFYFFAALAVGSALVMITRRNILHAALFLVMSLLATAGTFLQLQAEFLFIVQILLFAGGIMALFVLAIMLVKPRVPEPATPFTKRRLMVTGAALVFTAQVLFAIVAGHSSLRLAARQLDIVPRNAEAVGDALFHSFIVSFEVASVLLLVAMIGAVLMARRGRNAFD